MKEQREIPYFSQWESPEMVDDLLAKRVQALDDPLWKNSGANTKEEYELWSWNICGMACLKMILASIFDKEYKTIELAHKCEKHGGYVQKSSKVDGLYYKPMIKFLRKEFKLRASSNFKLSIRRIKKELQKGNYVIASVNSKIRDVEAFSTVETKGGHLVLVTGIDDKAITIHNPSGYYQKTQMNHRLSHKVFNSYFACRGIVIFTNKK